MKKTLWETYSDTQLEEAKAYAEQYRQFMSACKTERECVSTITKEAKAHGYRDYRDCAASGASLVPGDKVYAVNRGKMMMLVQIGKKTFQEHLNILGGHIDSPRLDLKPTPFYEDTGFVMAKTHYYGGIKKYQWLVTPLALHGVVAKKDGSVTTIVIGEKPDDPVLGISDLLPHFDKDYRNKPIATAFTGEDLNVCIGSRPLVGEEKDAVRANILKLMEDTYGIGEDDFLSAEFEVVPAGPARDYGIDRSMIMAYGHDDRICSYSSTMAQLSFSETVTEHTLVTLLVDKEEIGSMGSTGMRSHFFEDTIAEIMNLTGEYSELHLRRTLSGAKMISSDVTNGFDPNYPDVHDKNNAPYFGLGPTLHKYTGTGGKNGSNDASPEFIAAVRKIFDDCNVRFQMAELGKVDKGGGGTIAYIMGNYNMDVIDMGIPVHSMHAPWETASKVDLYEGYRAYRAFLEKM